MTNARLSDLAMIKLAENTDIDYDRVILEFANLFKSKIVFFKILYIFLLTFELLILTFAFRIEFFNVLLLILK